MKQHRRCPKCNSTQIITSARLRTRADSGYHNAELATYRHPNAVFLKGSQTCSVTAWACGQCGFVEFYADDPKALQIGPV